MSNIHSLADYRREGAAPNRGGTAAASTPLTSGGRSNFGTIGGLRSTEPLGGTAAPGGFSEVGYSYEVRLREMRLAHSNHCTLHCTALHCTDINTLLTLPSYLCLLPFAYR